MLFRSGIDIHTGIDSALLILRNRLKPKGERSEIQVHKQFGLLPTVECYAGELNQVFMNILSNAIDAIQERDYSSVKLQTDSGQIWISTQVIELGSAVKIAIRSEEHTSELQSLTNLVCRLLLEKKKKKIKKKKILIIFQILDTKTFDH